jgi:DNA-binding NtrC family response regulator
MCIAIATPGNGRSLRTDVRVICATNRDLRQEMRRGSFRPDLYYRLACLGVDLPGLHRRREDIPALARHLLGRLAAQGGRRPYLSDGALEALLAHDYPGNVRQLRNVLQAAAARVDGSVIDRATVAAVLGLREPLPAVGRAPEPRGPDAARDEPVEGDAETGDVPPARAQDGDSLAAMERDHLRRLLARHNANRAAVAAALGVSVRTVYRKMKRFELR